jgi:hypothetical protein
MRRQPPRAWPVLGMAAGLTAAAGVVGWACSFSTSRLMVSTTMPADAVAFAGGEPGVVKATYRRRELLHAYRALRGLAPLPDPPPEHRPDPPPLPAAVAEPFAALLRDSVKDTWPISTPVWRDIRQYNSIDNCLPEAFAFAAETLAARQARYGAGDRAVDDWIRGQVAVFRNCGGDAATAAILPEPAPEWADARLRADRAYQAAAASFYATQYDDAVRRFDAIAADASSEWRPIGAYLAARACIRAATVPEPDDKTPERWREAERRLRATLADAAATRWHAPARRLLTMVETRLRPAERMRALAARLSAAAVPDAQEVEDYLWLHRQWFDAASAEASLAVRADDVTDWIVVTRAGDGRAARQQWQATQAEAWLASALGLAKGDEADLGDLLAAAARVAPSSKAYASVVTNRSRLLVASGRLDEARALLAALPSAPAAGLDREAINLLEGHRMAVSRTLDEFLAHVPRVVIAEAETETQVTPSTSGDIEWDADARGILDARLPVDLLVAAAASTKLPPALRARVARIAVTRAVLLDRMPASFRAARLLRTLDPEMTPSLDRYLAATSEPARRRAGLLLLLRNPTLSIHPVSADDQGLGPWWWCHGWTVSSPPEAPSFVTAAQGATAAEELGALVARAEPRVALTEGVLAWAAEAPDDPAVPEALARAVTGWRYASCGGESSPLPKQAFDLLHRAYPKSPWTARTKYWYR